MSTSEIGSEGFPKCDEVSLPAPESETPPTAPRPLHRLRSVRREQGLTLRRLAQLMKTDVETLQREEEGGDISLTRLYEWQRALDVPVSELLEECDEPLSPPVLQRARMVRLMKTVAAILEKTENRSVRILADTMAAQLMEIMPELEGVTPWHSVGQRRTLGEFGRVAQHTYPTSAFRDLS